MPAAISPCSVCGEPARRKCTRCGRVFCNLHIRYGNPHFSLGSLDGGAGYYCDRCWAAYEKEARTIQTVIIVGGVIIILALIAALIAALAGVGIWSILR